MSKQFADNNRILKDLESYEIEYSKIYVPLQKIKQIFTENNLKIESESIEDILCILSHQFHKSKYPQHYNGNRQDEIGYKRDYQK